MRKLFKVFPWLLVLLMVAKPSLAGNFNISPVKIFLSAGQKTESLQIKNNSDHPLSLQIQAKEWQQDRYGKDVFQKTSDLVIFPQIFSIAPGEKRIVRVGIKIGPGAKEKTYRLFAEELPEVGLEKDASSLKFLLKMSMPVFFPPAIKATKQGAITNVGMQEESLAVSLGNTGNSSLFIKTITAKGIALDGEEITFPGQKGWYLLSGNEVSYPLSIDKDQCGKLKELQIFVDSDELEMNKVVSVDAGLCKG